MNSISRRSCVSMLLALSMISVGALSLLAESAPSSPSLHPSSNLSTPGETPSSAMSAPAAVSASGDVLYHEPAILESVRIVKGHRINFGMDLGFDMFHPEGTESSVFNVTYMRMGGNLEYRMAPNQWVQFSVKAPFLFHGMIYGGTSGVTMEDDTSGGMGQVSLGAKGSFGRYFGVQGFMELPTGDPDELPALGEGQNMGGMLLGEIGTAGPVALHAGVGQIIKSEYDMEGGAGVTVKRDPGDLTVLSLALTTQSRSMRRGRRSNTGQVGGVLELHTYTIGDTKLNGVTVDETGGTATNLVLGVNIGSQTGSTDTIFKTGVMFGIGNENLQSFDVARGAGDMTFFFNVGGRWGGSR